MVGIAGHGTSARSADTRGLRNVKGAGDDDNSGEAKTGLLLVLPVLVLNDVHQDSQPGLRPILWPCGTDLRSQQSQKRGLHILAFVNPVNLGTLPRALEVNGEIGLQDL